MFISIMLIMHVRVFFFFKQKTAYEMRISDWSSDVCSSDLDLPRLCGYPLFSGQTRAEEAVRVDKAPEQDEQDEARKPGNEDDALPSPAEDNLALPSVLRRNVAFPRGTRIGHSTSSQRSLNRP